MGAGHDHRHHAPVDAGWRDEADDRPLSIARRRFLTGKVVAVHGRLIDGLDLRVRARRDGDTRGVSIGGRTLTGAAADRDAMTAPETTVVETFEVPGGARGRVRTRGLTSGSTPTRCSWTSSDGHGRGGALKQR